MAENAQRFVMHGARAAMAGGMSHIEEQIKSIEIAVEDNPPFAFDLAKTLVESACRTILAEREVNFDRNDDLPRLFRSVSNTLPFLPPESSGEVGVRSSLAQTLQGLSSTLQGVAELRNACGFASHGTAGPRPVMEHAQAMLAAQAADSIVGFLHRIHKREASVSSNVQFDYADYEVFNSYVDDLHEEFQVFDVPIRSSEALYYVDAEAYRNYFAEYEPETGEDQSSKGGVDL